MRKPYYDNDELNFIGTPKRTFRELSRMEMEILHITSHALAPLSPLLDVIVISLRMYACPLHESYMTVGTHVGKRKNTALEHFKT